MTKNFSLFLALRYLRPRRTFVSVITLISVAGVALGVAVLIVVISVMAGFHAQIKNLSLGYDSHIEVFDRWGTSMFGDNQRPEGVEEKPWREVMKAIKETPGVTSVTPIVKGMVLLQANEAVIPSLMWGARQDDSDKLTQKHADLLVEGELDLSGNSIIIDENLAYSRGISVGDKVGAFPPANLRDIVNSVQEVEGTTDQAREEAFSRLQELSLPMELTVTGIFSPPRLQDMSDVPIVLVPLHIARELYNLDGGVSSLGIEVQDPYQAGEVKRALMNPDHPVLPESWVGNTWIEQHQVLFDTVQNEMEMMYFVLFIIVIVAAFCVMNTMITVTVQKRREIGIISALGSKISQIIWVFLSQGMIVGFIGSVVGFGLGLLIVYLRNDIRSGIAAIFGREIFSTEIYGLIEIPAKVIPHDVMIICSGAFLLCTVAALVPAFLAARTEPAVALRD